MLTPLEIENKVFKREMRGYSASEVDQFLAEIRESYETLHKENLAAKDRIAMLSDAIKQYKAMEETLQNALLVAQSAGEEVKKNAYEKADIILKDAQGKATEIINDAGKEVAKVNYKYEQMKRSVEVFKAKVVSLLNAQLDIIKEYSGLQSETDELVDTGQVELPKPAEAHIEQLADEKPQVLDDLERITQELPRIVMNENGEYISADEHGKQLDE